MSTRRLLGDYFKCCVILSKNQDKVLLCKLMLICNGQHIMTQIRPLGPLQEVLPQAIWCFKIHVLDKETTHCILILYRSMISFHGSLLTFLGKSHINPMHLHYDS
ncbi:hypothetical protein CR513_06909, partial [Mucuna pruriens]